MSKGIDKFTTDILRQLRIINKKICTGDLSDSELKQLRSDSRDLMPKHIDNVNTDGVE